MAENERIQPRPLTIGHIAVELGCDRRTVARALREAGGEPVSDLNGQACWTVRQALAALGQRAKGSRDNRLRRFERPAAELPDWLKVIDELTVSEFERGFVMGLLRAVYELPRVVGGASVQSGATMSQAFEIANNVLVALVHVTFEDARKVGIKPFAGSGDDGPEIIATSGFAPLNWHKVAADHGEPNWKPPVFAPGWRDIDAMDGEAAA